MAYTASSDPLTGPTSTAAVIYSRTKRPPRTRPVLGGRALSECRRHCIARSYRVSRVFTETGPGWLLDDRSTLAALMAWLAEHRPAVLVVRDWKQLAERMVDREAIARHLDDLGVRIETLYPGGEPHVVWDDPRDVTRALYSPRHTENRRSTAPGHEIAVPVGLRAA